MRLVIGLTSFFLASTIVASPIAEPIPIVDADISTTLAPRVLCQYGAPCWVDAQFNATLGYIEAVLIPILDPPPNPQPPITSKVFPLVEAAQATLIATLVELQNEFVGLTEEALETLKANLVAAVGDLFAQINAGVAQIIAVYDGVSPELDAVIGQVVSEVHAIEALIEG